MLVGIRLTLLRRSAIIYTVIFSYVTFFITGVGEVTHLFGCEFNEKKGASQKLAFSGKEKLREILEELRKNKIIHLSNSPFAIPIMLVKKRDDIMLCVDHRELNKVTVKDNFPPSLIDNHLDRLREKKYFSKL